MSVLGIVGGTGDLGNALALHFAKKHEVILGSRNFEKAMSSVVSIRREKGQRDYLEQNLRPAQNEEVVQKSDIVIVAVPHETSIETIKGLAGQFRGNQILVSAVASVSKTGDEFVANFDFGKSFAQLFSEALPSSVKVASAFQTVPANVLYKEREINADVLVAANEIEVYEMVRDLIVEIEGLRPLYLGTLNLSGDIERLTSLLLNAAKKNKLRSPTLKFNSF